MNDYKVVGIENPRTGEESVWVARDRRSMSPEDIVDDLNSLQAEVERLRAALQAIIDRDPARPGPKAAVVVSYQTAVAIAKQALAEQAGGDGGKP
jgi:hypothetical protein